LSDSQRIINVIRQAIEQETASGAKMHYTPGVVSESGGAYTASVFVRVDDLVEDVMLPSGAYLNSGDYVIVGMTSDGQKAWVDRILPRTLYSKMVFDYETASIGVGDGESSEYEWFELEEGASVNLDDGIVRPVGDSDISEAVDGVASGVYADAGHQHGVVQIHNQVYYRASGGDDAPGLQNIIDSSTHGVTIYLPDTTYSLQSQLVVDKSHVYIEGLGTAHGYHGGTVINCSSGAYAGILWENPVLPPYSQQGLAGGGLKNVYLEVDSNTRTHALELKSVSWLDFENCWFVGGSVSSVKFGVHEYAGGTPYISNSEVKFRKCFVYTSENGKGIEFTGQTDYANKSYHCMFEQVFVSHKNGTAWDLGPSDNHEFFLCSQVRQDGGTGDGWDLGIYASSHRWFGGMGQTVSPIRVQAGEFGGYGRGLVWFGLGTEDTTNQPIIEQGAQFRFVNDRGESTLVPDPRSFALLRDEFNKATGELGWGSVGGNVVRINGELSHPGIARCGTTAVSGTLAGMTLPALSAGEGIFLGSETFTATYIVRPNNVDSNTLIRVGFTIGGQNGADPPTGGIYFEKLDGDTNWFGVCRDSGSQTRANTNVAASTGWVKLVIRRLAGGGIGFFIGNVINQSSTAALSSNVPTAALQPIVHIKNSAAAAKTIDVDLFQLDIVGMDR
jgi:hypothetical protein